MASRWMFRTVLLLEQLELRTGTGEGTSGPGLLEAELLTCELFCPVMQRSHALVPALSGALGPVQEKRILNLFVRGLLNPCS